MDRQELHTLLETLHTQLQSAAPVAPEDRQLLQDLERDIQGLLTDARAGGPAVTDTPGLDRLRQAIQQLEVSHPYLTLGLNQLLDTLSRGGL
ncbi:MAG: DUF4404 family protein [Anaerolineales bacterium]|nr:DUF4404 family protein [Anaerolineales bacterium]